MAVIERKRITREQEPERAVFVASDGRRARLVRRAAFVTAFIAGLWLIGLGVGMLGFGSLPGVSAVKEQFDKVAGSPDASRAEPSKRVSTPTSRVSAPVEARRVVTPTRTRSVRSPAASEGATRRLAPHASPHASPRAGNDSAAGRRTDAREPGRAPARLGARRQHRTAGPNEAGRAATAPGDTR